LGLKLSLDFVPEVKDCFFPYEFFGVGGHR
jgi:hypothetical protein